MSWYVEDGRLTHDDLPDVLPRYVPPYPAGAWYVQNGKLTHSALPEVLPLYIPPLAIGIWYVENGRLTHSRLPQRIMSGAFSNCASLAQSSIPRTVKAIGENAFSDTALARVRIASDCTFSATSFPEGCIIDFYDGGE